jgi:hypothetical protein
MELVSSSQLKSRTLLIIHFLAIAFQSTLITHTFFFFHSCCPHLEHRPSLERFVSLQFLNLIQLIPIARLLPDTNRHPWLEWVSNPRSQSSSGRRYFMPQTARPLWSAVTPYANPYSRCTYATLVIKWRNLGFAKLPHRRVSALEQGQRYPSPSSCWSDQETISECACNPSPNLQWEK